MDRCLYASKPCFNSRSTKDNGDLHRLCLHHRAKANEAQRRWHSRQREVTDGAMMVKPSESETDLPEATSPVTPRRRRLASRQPHPEEASSASPTYLLIAPNVTVEPTPFPVTTMPVAPVDQHEMDEDMLLLDELLSTLDGTKAVATTAQQHQYYDHHTSSQGHHDMETYDWWVASQPPAMEETLRAPSS